MQSSPGLQEYHNYCILLKSLVTIFNKKNFKAAISRWQEKHRSADIIENKWLTGFK